MTSTRAALGVTLLVALTGTAVAAPPYTSSEGKYSVKFPGAPKTTETTAKSAVGELTVHVATYATSDGSTYMVSYTDFPETAADPKNHDSLLDGIRDGVKGKEGEVSNEEKTTVGEGKWPARAFTVKKGSQRIRMRVIVRGNRVYQVAAIGSARFIDGKDAKAFIDSLELK